MLRANYKLIIGGKKAWLPRLKGAVFYLNIAAANEHEALTRSITAAVSRAISEALNFLINHSFGFFSLSNIRKVRCWYVMGQQPFTFRNIYKLQRIGWQTSRHQF